ncbi:DivIVA domain-containing protein [Terrabacter sp. LjRoot27]|uniref:DivIVA domain-containing protein n=1 Tax=Terrabacter sp. LjRoot27 TaxID=3342306 RepID=UPI003ECE9098
MDRTAIADELRTARFRTTQFRQGYDEGAVDDLIDGLVQRLLSGDADHEIVAAVHACLFPTTTARRGYDMADVDAALDRVTTALGGATTPPGDTSADSGVSPNAAASTRGASGPAAPLPSAVTEPPRGFLARLLGR